MNIIVGTKETVLDQFPDRYTILELDAVRNKETNEVLQAYCVVGNVPLHEVITLDKLKADHQRLIEAYRTRDWDLCMILIEKLRGKFGGELNTFYDIMALRVSQFQVNDPGPDWDFTIVQ